ncbi:hypothetical protein AK812_SmicGene8347 [Symbiodinium microadriaticum]|uniref:Uncharacterized protein n=1 Tax=Symbiodinium microadriaticum TaxID=2951 RepID=A0A1Q9EL45_SYMMI|nr:hypothetical protein AK812_SmicGene8347 [Symbiodinium microadriaticum]
MHRFSPRAVQVKNPVTGQLSPFNVLGKSFADGSFTAEAKGGVLHILRGYFGMDLQQRARLLSEYNLLPSFFGRAMCQAHAAQEQYILKGQRMAWERAHEIRTMMLLEAAVARCLDRVEGRAAHMALCKEQPPPQEACEEEPDPFDDVAVTSEISRHISADSACFGPDEDGALESAGGMPLMVTQLPTVPESQIVAWVAGCPQEGCPPGQWIGLLLEAPASFQCIRIYQAEVGLVLGKYFASVA